MLARFVLQLCMRSRRQVPDADNDGCAAQYRVLVHSINYGGMEMNTGNEETKQPLSDAQGQPGERRKMSRREALALVGKHAVYTAPAVLAVLSVTKSNSARADECIPILSHRCD